MTFKPHDHWFIGPPPDNSRLSMRLRNWGGGTCPVDPKAKVYVIQRSGDIYMAPQEAGSFNWSHTPWWLAWLLRYERAHDIVGYRLARADDRFDGYETGTETVSVRKSVQPDSHEPASN